MINKNFTIKLDIKNDVKNIIPTFSLSDNNTSDISIKLVSDNKSLNIENTIPFLIVVSPNKYYCADFLEIIPSEYGLLNCNLPQIMKNEVGEWQAKLMLVQGDKRITTQTFSYHINYDDFISFNNVVESDDRYPVLTELISRLSTIELHEQERETTFNTLLENIKVDINNFKLKTVKDIKDTIDNYLINYSDTITSLKNDFNEAVSNVTNGNESVTNTEIVLARKGEKSLKDKMDKIDEQFNTKASKQEVDIERKRIDNFSTLKEGSTTGDAELIDGRVGVDGKIYSNIGNAIRNQFNSVNNYLNDKFIHEKSINLLNPSLIKKGYFVKGDVGSKLVETTNSSYSYFIMDFSPNLTITVTGTNYNYYLLDSDKNILQRMGSTVDTPNKTIIPSTNELIKYIAISFNHEIYPVNTYMCVIGETIPNQYVEYYDYYKLNNNIKIEYEQINNPNSKKIFHVGEGQTYTTFTECIKDLQNIEDEKIVYVHAGTYDIFNEIGGSEFALSVVDGSNWRDVSVVIPNNTTIIGLGYVRFEFLPTVEEIGNIACKLLSPINVKGNFKMENIEIVCQNCRYAIHDDGSSEREFDGSMHIYKNVKIKKLSGSGLYQLFGSGIGLNCKFEFENCIFDAYHTPFSVHNQWWATDSSIIFSNCVLYSRVDNVSVRLSSLSSSSNKGKIKVDFYNSLINQSIAFTNEDNNVNRTVPYEVTCVKCGDVIINSDAFDSLQFEPQIYN